MKKKVTNVNGKWKNFEKSIICVWKNKYIEGVINKKIFIKEVTNKKLKYWKDKSKKANYKKN